jgi:predicted nucleotide-binding protein (sugar kinase/HSP70/actin superfamily)
MANKPGLREREIFIPQMSYVASKLMSAAFRAFGMQAQPAPDSDERTIQHASKHLSGDECYPEMITLGNVLKVTERNDFRPEKIAFLLPTSGGPCRFGQYRALLKKVLRDLGFQDTLVLSPTSSDGYEGFGSEARQLLRIGWWAMIVADILRKLQLKTRPYEIVKGDTDQLFFQSIEQLFSIISRQNQKVQEKKGQIVAALIEIRDKFRAIPGRYKKEAKVLIGGVGEIFCRLNDFSNNFLIEKIEAQGGEVWISDISEWVWYTNDEQDKRLIRNGKRFSKEQLIARLKHFIQKKDEHVFWTPFKEDFVGYEEVTHIQNIMTLSAPYLTQNGALGEMVSSIGKALYLYHKGADGVIDISPFSCMNGIVCEAVFPQVSADHENFPIRTFYFDGTQTTVEQDVEIFMELTRNYQKRKKPPRAYPKYFN